jgi:hypothetical protein
MAIGEFPLRRVVVTLGAESVKRSFEPTYGRRREEGLPSRCNHYPAHCMPWAIHHHMFRRHKGSGFQRRQVAQRSRGLLGNITEHENE